MESMSPDISISHWANPGVEIKTYQLMTSSTNVSFRGKHGWKLGGGCLIPGGRNVSQYKKNEGNMRQTILT